MNTRNSALNIVVFLLWLGAVPPIAWAYPVYTYSDDFSLPIPANTNDTEGWMNDAVINIPDHHTIYDLDVSISLRHTKVFDLQIFLQSPSQKTICLNMYNPYDEYFDGEDYQQTIFDDEAETPIEQGQAPFTGRFRPRDMLSVFDGQDSFGSWRLRIYDRWPSDTGTFNRFEIMITEVPEPATVTLLIFAAMMTHLKNRPHKPL